MTDRKKTYFVFANSGGCPQNQLDGSRLCAYLDGNGYIQTENIKEAGFVFINSCSYRSEKEEEAFNAVDEFARKTRGQAKIVVTGCLPKIAPDKIAQLDNKYTVIPGTDLSEIEKCIPPIRISWEECNVNQVKAELFNYQKPFRRFLAKAIGGFRSNLPRNIRGHFDHLFMYDHSKKSFIVRIAEGCLSHCTYCAIRFSRGELHSKPITAIVDEVRAGVENGSDEILFTATELAAYGRDIKTDLSILLKEILQVPGDFDILLFYANPRWLIDIWERLEPVFKSGRIHFIHLSLNGTSDTVLQAMGRGYTMAEFESLIKNIRRVSPDTVLQTQVIVGFPGERTQDFQNVCAFLKRNYIHNVQIHAYDKRPGTQAATLPEHIHCKIRQKRRRILYRQVLVSKMVYNGLYLIMRMIPFFRNKE